MLLIEIPSVAVMLDVLAKVKLPSVFSISILPFDVLISDEMFALGPSDEILIFPFTFVISPFMVLVPLITVIVVLPSLLVTEAFCL